VGRVGTLLCGRATYCSETWYLTLKKDHTVLKRLFGYARSREEIQVTGMYNDVYIPPHSRG
jgi:hypothetical protein